MSSLAETTGFISPPQKAGAEAGTTFDGEQDAPSNVKAARPAPRAGLMREP